MAKEYTCRKCLQIIKGPNRFFCSRCHSQTDDSVDDYEVYVVSHRKPYNFRFEGIVPNTETEVPKEEGTT